MQQIERYGVIALVFLLVTIVAVSFWGDSKSPGFWSRLTGRGAKKDVAAAQVQPSPEVAPQTAEATPQTAAAPATATSERALATELPLSAPVAPANQAAYAVPPTADLGAQSPTAMAPQVARNEPAPVAPLAASTPPPAAPVVRTVHAAAPSKSAPTGSVPYTVQKGDSLMRIAAKTLGSKERWTEIRDLNHGVDPRSLKVGMKLDLPASAARASTETKHVVPVKKSATTTAPKKEAPAASTDTYLVRKGDTMKTIAERRLGSRERWREIAAANPKVDPNRLLVGAELRVPKAKSSSHLEPKGEPVLAVAMPRETSRAGAPDRPHVR